MEEAHMTAAQSIAYLPLLGIGIIIFCVLSFVFPYGARFRDKVQKVSAFGLNMEISVITFFVLIGFACSFTGIFLKVRDYEDRLTKATQAREAAEFAFAQSQKMQISALVTLKDVAVGQLPKLEELRGLCRMINQKDFTEVKVTRGIVGTQFRITFDDLTRTSVISSLVLEETKPGGRRWIYDRPISPFEPNFVLEAEK